MQTVWAGLSDMPLPTRFAVIGAVVLGIAGGIAGLIIGLFVYPPPLGSRSQRSACQRRCLAVSQAS